MNSTDRAIIRQVIAGNVLGAKASVKEKLLESKAKKDEKFVETMLSNMEYQKNVVPNNLTGVLKIEEEVEMSRYYLSKEEDELFKEIESTYKASKKLEELGIRYPNSLMLHGESGTGKTTFARYVAYKLGIPYIYVTFSMLVDSQLGATQKKLHDVFNYVSQRECVFVLDEMDAIALTRGSQNDVGEMARIVITLMQCMDDLTNSAVVLGITNRFEGLDAAVRRRFKREHEVKRLDRVGRLQLVEAFKEDLGEYTLKDEQVTMLVEEDTTQAELYDKMVEVVIKNIKEKGN